MTAIDHDPGVPSGGVAPGRADLEFGTVPNMVLTTAARWPGDIAVVQDDREITYAKLARDMLAAVNAMVAEGVRPGDRVAVWAPNSYFWMVVSLAAQGAGGIVVPLNTRYKGAEAAFILRNSGARLLFTVQQFLGTDYPAALRAADPDLSDSLTVVVDDLPEAGDGGSSPLQWSAFLRRAAAVPERDALTRIGAVRPDHCSDILFTSGTTGHPKGVMLTHAQCLRAHAGTFAEGVAYRRGGRSLLVLPFFHAFGYKAGWTACLAHGCTVIPHRTFEADAALRAIAERRVDVVLGSPTIFFDLLDHPQRAQFDLRSLRSACVSAAHVPAELVVRMRDDLGFDDVITGYGLTEATAHVTLSSAGDSIVDITTTVGRAGRDVEVAVVDGRGLPAGPDTVGEVLVRGYNVMSGYWDNPTATAERLDADGWLHTGDLGRMDDRGYLTIVDRLSDLYTVGGLNVYPAEVERVLGEFDGVERCAVVAAPDARLGEVGVAFVVPATGAVVDVDILTRWCRERLANFKVPRAFVITGELPLTASMKISKGDLRQRAVDAVQPVGPTHDTSGGRS